MTNYQQKINIVESNIQTHFLQHLQNNYENEIDKANDVILFKNLNSLGIKILQHMNEEELDRVNTTLSLFQNLESIQINSPNSAIDPDCFKGIIQGFQSLPKLNSLNLRLYNGDIRPRGFGYLKKVLKKMTQLKSLDLEIYKINMLSDGAYILGETLLHLVNLEKFKFNSISNQIQSSGMKGLSLGLRNLTKLTSIHILLSEDNYIGEAGFVDLFKNIENLTNLTTIMLDLSDSNIIGQGGAIAFGNCIQKLKKMQFIRLQVPERSEIKSQGFQNIIEGISFLENINHLDLEIRKSNQIGKGVECLEQSFKNLKNLKSFALSIGEYNQINDINTAFIAQGLQQLTGLEKLSITLQLSDTLEALIGVVEAISNLKNLYYLKISIKIFSQSNCQALIPIMKKMQQLQYISYEINYEGGIHRKQFKKSLKRLVMFAKTIY